MLYSFPDLESVHCSMSGSDCCFLTCIKVSQEAGKVVWSSHLLKKFPQFVVIYLPLEKAMAPYSSVLAWRIPGMGEPGGLPSMGSHRVGHDRSDLAHSQRLWRSQLKQMFFWNSLVFSMIQQNLQFNLWFLCLEHPASTSGSSLVFPILLFSSVSLH